MQTVPLFDTAQPGCRLPALKTKGYIRDGDIIIGGIFPVHFSEALPESSFTKLPESIHCGELQYRYYRWLHGMVFAIEEINQNRKLLPNITLGFRIYDSCFLVQRATEGTIWLVTGHEEPIPNYRCQKQSPLAAILGDGPSHTSIPIARLLGIYSYPQKEYLEILSGTIGIMNRKGVIPGFQEYLYSVYPSKFPTDIFIKEFWEKAFDCKWLEGNSDLTASNDTTTKSKLCTGEEKLNELNNAFFDGSNLQYTYNVYTAVYTVAHALHDMYTCNPGWGPFVNRTCADILDFEPWQIPRSVCSESCLPGYRKAVHPGQPICCFDCVPCSIGEISNETDATECLKCPDDHWSNEKQDKCIPKTIEFLSFEEPMGAALLAITISCASITAIVLCIFVKYRDTPIVKANNRELSYLLLLAIMLSFLCSLIFIGEPRTETCMLRQSAFGIIFALCVSCVLAKTIMVVIAFNATKPNSKLKKWVGPKLSRCIVLAGTLIQFIICIVWLTSSPPFPEQNMKSQTGMIIIQCNEASTIAFWFVLGYMGILAIVSFIVAFLARNLPDSFNDAKFITFSMLVFVTVWLVFIPAYLSTRGKYMVAVEIFAILASSAGLLACIFFPKCYIILLRPEENTKEHLIGKNKIDHRKKRK
nr:PREDICTED: vomeronasal type-2 receptor 26-like isoform X2 [Latimeria chalumnae]|eukprot:XP_014350166.1 PREDICTED: vomeronasal type-2 receptor 26-like isoform X2 [Latimeria chalumnae]